MDMRFSMMLALALIACDSTGDEDEDDGQSDDGGGTEPTFTYRALVLQMDGLECTECPADVLLYVCGEMTNTTDEEQLITTPTTCIVDTWSIAGSSGTEDLSYYCTDDETDWTIKPQEVMLRCSAAWTGGAGSYVLTVDWATGGTATTDFVLE